MAKWTVNYSDSVEVEARTEDEAIREACDRMFCDGPNDCRFSAVKAKKVKKNA
jgi:hypothetical protein